MNYLYVAWVCLTPAVLLLGIARADSVGEDILPETAFFGSLILFVLPFWATYFILSAFFP